MAGKGEDAAHVEAEARDARGELACVTRRDAGAVLTRVELDEDLDHRRAERLAQLARGRHRVAADADARAFREGPQAPPSLVVDPQGVGDEHVVEARVDEDLGLTDRRDGDAVRRRVTLHRGDLRHLVRLDVRPQRDTGVTTQARHGVDVAFEHVEVGDEAGRGGHENS